MGKISHSCLINGGSCLNILSKLIIMEKPSLACTSEVRNMLTFNKKVQLAIGKIKHLTLVICARPKISITYNFLVVDMEVGNYTIILGHEWQHLTSGSLA
jgi:hypothetical protein